LGGITINSIHAAEALEKTGGGTVVAHSQGTSGMRGAFALLFLYTGDFLLSSLPSRSGRFGIVNISPTSSGKSVKIKHEAGYK
jgi:hypothetical protein